MISQRIRWPRQSCRTGWSMRPAGSSAQSWGALAEHDTYAVGKGAALSPWRQAENLRAAGGGLQDAG